MSNFIVYAHRGASEYFPENTLSSFRAGLAMGANGIETDVQMTSDGELVLFHDDTLKRVTGEAGSISDYTLEEIRNMTVTNAAFGRADKILTLRDFIDKIGCRVDITFAIEIKQRGIVGKVMDKLADMRERVIITSFMYYELCDAAGRGFRLGWLYSGKTDGETINKLRAIGAYQGCPKAADLTVDGVRLLRENGFGCRAWGISNLEIMKNAVRVGVDGMTVNFPDKLIAYMGGMLWN